MQVFWGVLQQPMSAIVVLDRVHWERLESAPANRHDQRIPRLEYALMPAMFFKAYLKFKHIIKSVNQSITLPNNSDL